DCQHINRRLLGHPFKLLCPINTFQPAHPILRKLLDLRPQLRLVQAKVIHRPDPQDAVPRPRRPDAVHQRPARRAEVVRHRVALARHGAALRVRREVLAAADVRQVRVRDGEVGREHGRGDLAAVGAVAHECVDEPRAFGWLWRLRC
ncbi:unnamed protein product, partial [Mycena citricolor]